MTHTTPRPWFIEGAGYEAAVFSNTGIVASITGDEITRPANAALIVQAVNTHDRAKAVLQLLLDEYGEGGMLDGQPIIAQAKALLTDMEG